MSSDTPTVLPSLIKSTLGRMLGAALNRAAMLDPAFPEQLKTLEGRHLDFHLTSPPLAFAMTVREGRFAIGPVSSGHESDLSLSASLGAVLSQLLPGRESTATVGRMRISGDAELARQLQRLMRRYEPDFEAQFVAVFGDVLGVQLARAVKHGLNTLREGGKALARDSAEFLTEESRDLVPRAELEAFCDDVDDLRDAVERLERRMQRLGISAAP
ncbi:SCP2 sterol-binding domain-containing protein [Xanthomonadaceae bacterium JHOS43]|nr:SCP2 sterol-binding domain-containing protein [Xanthomonadaceae bacterium JHOS43]